jgi:hypothetical protein
VVTGRRWISDCTWEEDKEEGVLQCPLLLLLLQEIRQHGLMLLGFSSLFVQVLPLTLFLSHFIVHSFFLISFGVDIPTCTHMIDMYLLCVLVN